jgi:negative regulator of sigma E activity
MIHIKRPSSIMATVAAAVLLGTAAVSQAQESEESPGHGETTQERLKYQGAPSPAGDEAKQVITPGARPSPRPSSTRPGRSTSSAARAATACCARAPRESP